MDRRYLLIFAAALIAAAGLPARAVPQSTAATTPPYQVSLAADLEWQVDPEFPELDYAMVHGDLTSAGRYVYRLRANAPAVLPLHSHGKSEYVTVLQGTLEHAPEGADRSEARSCGAGCFIVIPAGRGHQGWMAAGTILQIHGVGPAKAHAHIHAPPGRGG